MAASFSYLLYHRYGDRFEPFKSLDDLVTYLISREAGASFMTVGDGCRLVKELVLDEANPNGPLKEEDVSLAAYVEEQPVDLAAIEVELDAARAKSLAEWKRLHPHGILTADGHRAPEWRDGLSGDCWLFEMDKGPLIRAEAERRRWKWKALTPVAPL